jgi:hypothetical protein
MESTQIMGPVIQYGFAGFSVILLAILIWLIRELLSILKENNIVITKNTEAINTVAKVSTESFAIMIQIKDELLRRSGAQE